MRKMKGETRNEELKIPISNFRIPNSTWLWLVIILSAAGALRWARMDLSLYNDEAHAFQTYIAGRYKEPDAKGVQKWRQVLWKETFFKNKTGNNSAPFSSLSRLSYEVWKGVSKAKNGAMCETALRLPALLAGLGSLLVLWLLVRRMIDEWTAWLVLLLGALHPWHIRYSTEARGYGLLLLGVVLCFYLVLRALEDGRWRWWLGLGLAQFFCVWSFSGAVLWLVVFNALLAAHLTAGMLSGKVSWEMLQRALVGLLCGGMMTGQFCLPTAQQVLEMMDLHDSLEGTMGLLWWQDALGGAVFGMRWVDSDALNPWNPAGSRLLALKPWLVMTLVVITMGMILGAVRWCSRGLTGVLIAVSAPLGVALSWALMVRKGTYLHPWYVLYALPGLLMCLSFSIDFRKKILAGAMMLFLCASLAPWWLEADRRFLTMSKENLKGVALTVLQEAGGGDFLLGGAFTDVDVYEQRFKTLDNVGELDALINEARSSKRKLMVTYGFTGLVQANMPELMKRFQNAEEFRLVAVLHGLEEEQFTHRVLVWQPEGRK